MARAMAKAPKTRRSAMAKASKNVKSPKEKKPNMTPEEKAAAIQMYVVQKIPLGTVGKAFGRGASCIYKVVKRRNKPSKRGPGRPRKLSEAQVDRVIAKKNDLMKKAGGQKEITRAHIIRSSRVKVGGKTIYRRFKERKVAWRPHREKIVLSAEDKKVRLAFARLYLRKNKAWWVEHVHCYIDNKFFQVYHNGKHREWIARRSCRGGYRTKGQGLEDEYVRPRKELHYNTGKKAGLIMAGITKGKVTMWREHGGNWTGDGAAQMYKRVLQPALKKAWPKRTKPFVVLEDNDPTGYKSNKGKEAKKEANIDPLNLPPRSPDLNVLDYYVWDAVNKRMRRAERDFPKSKKETREAFLNRLRKTAVSLPQDEVRRAQEDMVRRCKLLAEAEGGHFEEGGKTATAEALEKAKVTEGKKAMK